MTECNFHLPLALGCGPLPVEIKKAYILPAEPTTGPARDQHKEKIRR